MKPRKATIAIAPIKYYDINKTHNTAKIKKCIAKARKAGADIICFPESCIKKAGSITLDSRHIKEIQEECKRNSIWCIVTEDVQMGKKTFNTSILIDRKGKIRGKYRKINLYGDTCAPGNKVRVFKTDFAKIGVVICWDLASPGLFQTLRKMGAEIVFCPAQWWYDTASHKSMHKKREIHLLRSMVLARAFENIFFIALCNPLMDSKYQISYSAIASPHRILKELTDKEGVITARLNLNEIRKFRKYYSK